MNKCLRKRVVNRQLIVLFESGKMHVCLQVESRKLRVEGLSQRAITQQHEIPRRVSCDFRLLPVYRVGSDESREILLWNKSRRSKKIIFRQPVLVSDFECSLPAVAPKAFGATKAGSAKVGISNFCSATRKVMVIDHVVSGKDSFARHSKFNQIVDVPLTADECGRVKIDDPSLEHFLPPGARFVLPSTLRHHNHRYSTGHATIRRSQ